MKSLYVLSRHSLSWPKTESERARKILSLEEAFLATAMAWAEKENVGSSVIPSSFGVFSIGIGSPPIWTGN